MTKIRVHQLLDVHKKGDVYFRYVTYLYTKVRVRTVLVIASVGNEVYAYIVYTWKNCRGNVSNVYGGRFV